MPVLEIVYVHNPRPTIAMIIPEKKSYLLLLLASSNNPTQKYIDINKKIKNILENILVVYFPSVGPVDTNTISKIIENIVINKFNTKAKILFFTRPVNEFDKNILLFLIANYQHL